MPHEHTAGRCDPSCQKFQIPNWGRHTLVRAQWHSRLCQGCCQSLARNILFLFVDKEVAPHCFTIQTCLLTSNYRESTQWTHFLMSLSQFDTLHTTLCSTVSSSQGCTFSIKQYSMFKTWWTRVTSLRRDDTTSRNQMKFYTCSDISPLHRHGSIWLYCSHVIKDWMSRFGRSGE